MYRGFMNYCEKRSLASHGDFRARLRGRRNPQRLAGGFAPVHPHQGRLCLPVDPSVVVHFVSVSHLIDEGLAFMEDW
jgi:hypothetical protein